VSFEAWILLVGGLLLLLGSAGWLLRAIPFLTPAMLYLAIGAALGPWGWGVIRVDPVQRSTWLHHAAEVGVIVSLFTVGLKVRLPLKDARWLAPVMLATVAMALTVALIAATSWWLVGLPLGAAVLLGAILAPTDPVLASDVQLRHAKDESRLRFTLSVEAGLNDGTAFPFVMLGLGLLGLHQLGAGGWRWWTVDVLWAVAAGLSIGLLLGYAVGRWLLRLGSQGREGTGAAVYLVGGTIGVSYAAAVFAEAYGFLAVFAAAVGLRAVERQVTGGASDSAELEAELSELRGGEPVDPKRAAVHFAGALLRLSEYIERLLEIGLVLIVGAAIAALGVKASDVLLALLLLLILRPLAVLPLWVLNRFTGRERAAIAWFGIRGIGSVYYLMFAIDAGLAPELAERLSGITLTAVAFSILAHGATVAPVLQRLRVRRDRTTGVQPDE
jgi:sodium/hydrogen antiporter